MEVSINEQTPSIKLVKGQKDAYGWEIKLFGKDIPKVLEELKQVNDRLLQEYSGGEGE
ncbi:MAG: hypothetical protein KKH04_19485 [Proteobacteria bacterium]|nr:hypothetical protein [Pseudomonadota bacterium]